MLKDAFLARLSEASRPLALAELIYRQGIAAAKIRRINLICSDRAGTRSIVCFVETPAPNDALSLALHFGASVFGDQWITFDMPKPAAFDCSPCQFDGDANLPARVSFNCLSAQVAP